MQKGIPNKQYTAEFKQHVIETMLAEGLAYKKTERLFKGNRENSCQFCLAEEEKQEESVDQRRQIL